jgi:hypothetical protein
MATRSKYRIQSFSAKGRKRRTKDVRSIMEKARKERRAKLLREFLLPGIVQYARPTKRGVFMVEIE